MFKKICVGELDKYRARAANNPGGDEQKLMSNGFDRGPTKILGQEEAFQH